MISLLFLLTRARTWVTTEELRARIRDDREILTSRSRQPEEITCSKHRFTNLDNYNICYDRPQTSSMSGKVTFVSTVSNPVSSLFLYVGNLQSVSVNVQVEFDYKGRYFYAIGQADAILFSECVFHIHLNKSLVETQLGSSEVYYADALVTSALLSYSAASLRVFDCVFTFSACAGKVAGFLIDVRKEIYFGSTEAELLLVGTGVTAGIALTSRCNKIILADTRILGNLTNMNPQMSTTSSALISDPVVVPVLIHGAGYCFRGKLYDPTKLDAQWNGTIRNCVKAEFQKCLVTGAPQTIDAKRVINGIVFQAGQTAEMDITLKFDGSYIQSNWTLYNLQTTFRHIKISGIVNLSVDVNATLFNKAQGQSYHCIQIRIPTINSSISFYFIQQIVRSINVTHLYISSTVVKDSKGLIGIFNDILANSVVHVESVRIEGDFETKDQLPDNCLLFNTSTDASSIHFKRVSVWPRKLDMGTGVSLFLNKYSNTVTNEQYSGHLWVTDCMAGLGVSDASYGLSVKDNFGGIVGEITDTWLIFTRIDIQLFAKFTGKDSSANNLGMASAKVHNSNITINNVTVFSEIELSAIKENFGFLGLVENGYHYVSGLKFDILLKGTTGNAGFYGTLTDPVNATFANVSVRNTTWEPSGGFLFGTLTSGQQIYLDVFNVSCANTTGTVHNLLFYEASNVRLFTENLTLLSSTMTGGLAESIKSSRVQMNEIYITNKSVISMALVNKIADSSINIANLTYRGSTQNGAVKQLSGSLLNMTNVTVEDAPGSVGTLGAPGGSSGTFFGSNFSSTSDATVSDFCTAYNGRKGGSVKCGQCAGKGCA